ncbi:hypothetical protein [Shinella sp. DD12]|uniref:hypothetical protein n=1 Tax=Shinella sp. DD12 TaxID=1410620 RepID=UPI0003C56D9C|nr:hypothetical protein [Shinella sp. DD12]EYR81430.1 hypothetical protein SHLA_15c001150 [Shinella sp. DD12]MCA0344474.1 hypothetical protein [Pseudomonadota bacterium]
MTPRRVKLHELYREVEALGGATECAEDRAYNKAICDVLQTLRASGFGDGFYIDQREFENRERRGRAVLLQAAQ